MTLKHKVGKFTLHASFIKTRPDDFKRIMGKCIIVSCIHDWVWDAFDYTALSDEFEEVPTAEPTLNYTWKKDWDGQMRAYHA